VRSVDESVDRRLGGRSDVKAWTFLTNHARVLICIARTPQARVRDIAERIGITERATQIIISDLEETGYLTRTRVGRRNAYTVNADLPFRHPVEADHAVQDLLALFIDRDKAHPLASRDPFPAAGERAARDEY
jgi:hypothetical protein